MKIFPPDKNILNPPLISCPRYIHSQLILFASSSRVVSNNLQLSIRYSLSYVYTRVAYALCTMFLQFDWSKFILDEAS